MAEQIRRYRGQTAVRIRSVDGILPRPAQYTPRPAAARPPVARPRVRPAGPARFDAGPQYYAPPKPQPTALSVPRIKRQLRAWQPAVAVVAVIAVSLMAYGHFSGAKHTTTGLTAIKHVANVASSLVSKKSAAETPQPNAQLVADLNRAIASQPGLQASTSLIDLNTGLTYDAGSSTTMFTTASTGKLITVFDYIHQVELGKATLTQTIGGDSAQDIIRRMIVYSDNNAWAALNSYLTLPQEQSYMDSLGIRAVVKSENWQITSAGMAQLLSQLYNGKLMNADHQAMIYNYMSHTTVTNLIQAALPADATVYHKYGQILGVLHDASIIEYQGHDFVLVVYTNNPDGTSDMYNSQVSLIHSVATAAFSDITAN